MTTPKAWRHTQRLRESMLTVAAIKFARPPRCILFLLLFCLRIVPGVLRSGQPDFGYVVDAAQKKAQERLTKLVPDAKHMTKTNSGHEIHKEQPQLVIDAIRQVVEAVRNGRLEPPNSQRAE